MGNCASSNDVADGSKPKDGGVDEELTFVPKVGFVAKTKKPISFAINKVFINIFHHSRVKFVLCNEGQVGVDKSGGPCVIYDIVISSAVFTKLSLMQADDCEAAKLFVGEQVIAHINKIYNESLDLAECKIPKMKRGYVGEEIATFMINTAPTNLQIRLDRSSTSDNLSSSSQELPVHVVGTSTSASVVVRTPELSSTEQPGPVSTGSTASALVQPLAAPSVPLPAASSSPPSMKGNLWCLDLSGGTSGGPQWRRKNCVLLEGKINSDGEQTALDRQKAYSFKLTNRMERATDAVVDSVFDSSLSTVLLKALLFNCVGKARHAARNGTWPAANNGQVELGAAAAVIGMEDLLPQSAANSISCCSTLIVLCSGGGRLASSGGYSEEGYICYLCEGDKDSFRWTNAINAHLLHYFPTPAGPAGRDEDDDDVGVLSELASPPIIQGDGKKQGRHIIKTWKQRYFVAENGVLSYYEGAVDIYPYGVDKRGDIVLTTFIISMSHNVRKNTDHQSDTASSVDNSSAIKFHSDVLKEDFIIVLDNILDEHGFSSPTAWFEGLQAHIAYAKAQNIS